GARARQTLRCVRTGLQRQQDAAAQRLRNRCRQRHPAGMPVRGHRIMTLRNPSRSRRARGFTLIEALVALLVLSIGLLGVAALQLTSLRSNPSSSFRSQATLLAYDVVDRMRANPT